MKQYELVEKLDELLNKDLSYKWDNTGLILQSRNNDINKIFLTLEITKDSLKEAIEENCDMIIAHHPLLFSPINTLTYSDLYQQLTLELVKNDIAVYVAHTNFDRLENGLNDYVINLLGVKEVETLVRQENEDVGMGKIAKLNKKYSFDEFLLLLQEKFNTKEFRYTARNKKDIERVAVVTGSGTDFSDYAFSKNADVFITGDVKYHQAQEYYQKDFFVVDMGHYHSEKFFPDALEKILRKHLDIQLIKSKYTKDPFKFMQ